MTNSRTAATKPTPREHPIDCQECGRIKTDRNMAVCDPCFFAKAPTQVLGDVALRDPEKDRPRGRPNPQGLKDSDSQGAPRAHGSTEDAEKWLQWAQRVLTEMDAQGAEEANWVRLALGAVIAQGGSAPTLHVQLRCRTYAPLPDVGGSDGQ